MSGPLDRARIVVTRPAAGTDTLSAALAEAGAEVLAFPALTLHATGEPVPAGPFDWIVFTSPAAVEFGWSRVRKRLPPQVAAPGAGTAEMLRAAGVEMVTAPNAGAGMAALLKQPAFLEGLAGRTVLVVSGRPLNRRSLARLRERGAKPTGFCVYERRPAKDVGPLADWLRDGAADAIMVSSVAAADALAALRLDWGGIAWIVSSGRVAAAVEARGGCVGAIADSAETSDLVAAARRWRKREGDGHNE